LYGIEFALVAVLVASGLLKRSRIRLSSRRESSFIAKDVLAQTNVQHNHEKIKTMAEAGWIHFVFISSQLIL
jgi:hypothetical protein